jgi:hypothetical protein
MVIASMDRGRVRVSVKVLGNDAYRSRYAVLANPPEPITISTRIPGLATYPLQRAAMSRAVSRLISGQRAGNTSVAWMVPIIWRQRA